MNVKRFEPNKEKEDTGRIETPKRTHSPSESASRSS